MWKAFTRSFQEWWSYFRTYLPFAFNDFKEAIIGGSAFITYLALICSIVFKEDLLKTMYGLLLALPFILVPLVVFLTVFIYSLYPNGRERLGKYLRAAVPQSVRISDLESKVESISKTLNGINETLKNINTTLNRHESTINNLVERIEAIERDKTTEDGQSNII